MKLNLWRWFAVVVALGLGVVALAPARAADPGKEEEKEDVDAKVLRYLAESTELAEFGRKYKSPEALVTAGSLLLWVEAATGGIEKMAESKEVPVDRDGKKVASSGKERGFKDQADDLFDAARGLGDPGVEATIKAAQVRKYVIRRAAVCGPKKVHKVLQIGGLHTYTFEFEAHKPGVITMQSSQPVRIVISQPKVGGLFNTVGGNAFYSWSPMNPGGGSTVKVKVEIHAMSHEANYTIFTR